MKLRALRRVRRRRGYTLVELMMALALFTVAVLGIVSLQKITVVSNAHAKNLAVAQRIAQTWATQLQMDSTSWRTAYDSAGVLPGLTADTWTRPPFVQNRVGGAFDVLGNALTDSAPDLQRARFCTHVRLSTLYGDTGVTGNRVMRAEIRVFWPRDGQGAAIDGYSPTEGLCQAVQETTRVTAIGNATNNYHFIYQTVGIRQHFQI